MNIKAMLDQSPGHPWHVRWFRSEDVTIIPEETDERAFLFGIQPFADQGRLGVVACSKVNDFELYFVRQLDFGGTRVLFWDLEFFS